METKQHHTVEAVAAMIGEDWSINVSDAIQCDALCVNWQNCHIYTDDRSVMGSACTVEEYHGFVTVYCLRRAHRLNPDFFLKLIADNAEAIASVADGYEEEFNGQNHVATFAMTCPSELFEEILDLRDDHPDVNAVWEPGDWMTNGETLSELMAGYPRTLATAAKLLAKYGVSS